VNARTALATMADFPIADIATIFGTRPALILAPHPDDESLGCGGFIAEACRQGLPPVIAILTDGSQSHPASKRFDATGLRLLREEETRHAVSILGLPDDRLIFLRHPDTQAPTQGDALHAAAREVADLLHAFGCGSLVVSWRHDPHCDHEAAALIAKRARALARFRLLSYPVWGLTLPPDHAIVDDRISGFRLDVAMHLERKRRAILAHASQYAGIIDDDPDGFQMEASFIARFLTSTETYIDSECAA
jgi:LmbE family N-acetylglucosaminyl deacetylase